MDRATQAMSDVVRNSETCMLHDIFPVICIF